MGCTSVMLKSEFKGKMYWTNGIKYKATDKMDKQKGWKKQFEMGKEYKGVILGH